MHQHCWPPSGYYHHLPPQIDHVTLQQPSPSQLLQPEQHHHHYIHTGPQPPPQPSHHVVFVEPESITYTWPPPPQHQAPAPGAAAVSNYSYRATPPSAATTVPGPLPYSSFPASAPPPTASFYSQQQLVQMLSLALHHPVVATAPVSAELLAALRSVTGEQLLLALAGLRAQQLLLESSNQTPSMPGGVTGTTASDNSQLQASSPHPGSHQATPCPSATASPDLPMPPPAPGDTEPGPRQLIVNYLPFDTTDDELMQLFGEFGPVEVARVIYDKATKRTKGFGFVYYRRHVHAVEALQRLTGHHLRGKRLKVSYAVPQRPVASLLSDLDTTASPPGSIPTLSCDSGGGAFTLPLATANTTSAGEAAEPTQRAPLEFAAPWSVMQAIFDPQERRQAAAAPPLPQAPYFHDMSRLDGAGSAPS